MNDREIKLSSHAYERYCQRVEKIKFEELKQQLHEQQANGIYYKDGYVYMANLWWRGDVTDDEIQLYTCYGHKHMDIPAAVKWAKRFNDRIALG